METSGQRIRGIRAAAVTDTSRARRGVSPVSLALVFFPFRQSGAPGRALSSARARRHTCRRQHPPTQKHHGRSYRLHVRHVHRGARQGAWPAGRFPGRVGRAGERHKGHTNGGKPRFRALVIFAGQLCGRPDARGRRAGRLRRTIVAASFVTHGRRPRRTRAVRATPVVCTHAPLSGEYPKERLIFIPRRAGRRVLRCGAETRRVILFLFLPKGQP